MLDFCAMVVRKEFWIFLLAMPYLVMCSIKDESQEEVPASQPFPCDVSGYRSASPPTSVHRLRPGDIDVVGAIGDSLTAATSALGQTVYDLFTLDNRGVSFSMGGQKTWRQYLTLPNILREYNPRLIGYSLGNGLSVKKNSQFNVAVSGAMDQDLLYEAKVLVGRMRKDPRVDMAQHWKLINVWIGTNDICSDECYDKSQTAETHRKNLQLAIDYLYDNLPRTFINLISAPYIPAYSKLKDIEPICHTTRRVLCSCLFGVKENEKLEHVEKLTREYQRAEQELVASGRYAQREDFTVEFQPTFLNLEFPVKQKYDGSITTDYSYLSIDCFHYSQKFHARAANLLWNNLLEEPGNKTTNLTPIFQKFHCPRPDSPFLRTLSNSGFNNVKRAISSLN